MLPPTTLRSSHQLRDLHPEKARSSILPQKELWDKPQRSKGTEFIRYFEGVMERDTTHSNRFKLLEEERHRGVVTMVVQVTLWLLSVFFGDLIYTKV